jgi:hypothetical protein
MSGPMPVVVIEDRRGTVPEWTLRLALVATSYGLLAVLTTEGVPVGVLIILGLVALAGIVVPASPAAAVLGGGAAILLAVFSDGEPVRPAVLASIVLVHLLHVLSAMVAVLPVGSRIHLSALRRPALRFLAIQAVVFALAALAWRLPRSPTPIVVEVAALLAVTAVAALVLFQLRRR